MPTADPANVVMDASTTVSFLMHDEQAPAALSVLKRIENGLVPHVPIHWRIESPVPSASPNEANG
ncbi:MAG: hypothetical protein LBR07_03680 [Puniceicoccales bacterium]|jgi:hypothetical protein|nr:hypothetical protein [Puniceicoccales bacterium]